MENNLTEFIKVNSSAINNAWYDNKKATLALEFKSGKNYFYDNVPYFVYEGLRSSVSKGKFINKHIIGKFETNSNKY